MKLQGGRGGKTGIVALDRYLLRRVWLCNFWQQCRFFLGRDVLFVSPKSKPFFVSVPR